MTDKERKYYRNKYRHVRLCFAHGRGWDNLTLSAAMILDGYWPSIPFWLKHLWSWAILPGYYYTKLGVILHKLRITKLDPPSYKFSTIKEKFGSLCLYCIATPDVIDVLEAASYNICEQCGSTKDVGRTDYRIDGWVYTLCKEHGDYYKGWKPIKVIIQSNYTEIKSIENETDREN
jgi:hypothetical protein